MGWMKAIATDFEELAITVGCSGTIENMQAHVARAGWVPPTVSELARTLISDVMERTPHNDEDTKQLQRVIGLLGEAFQ